MMTDPIADMLTRIRNAGQAKHKWVDMPVSNLKVEVARLLQESHFVHAHKVLEDGRFGVLRVYLKYHDEKPIIRHLEHAGLLLGIAIMSTSAGVLSDREARAQGVGGEVLARVW